MSTTNNKQTKNKSDFLDEVLKKENLSFLQENLQKGSTTNSEQINFEAWENYFSTLTNETAVKLLKNNQLIQEDEKIPDYFFQNNTEKNNQNASLFLFYLLHLSKRKKMKNEHQEAKKIDQNQDMNDWSFDPIEVDVEKAKEQAAYRFKTHEEKWGGNLGGFWKNRRNNSKYREALGLSVTDTLYGYLGTGLSAGFATFLSQLIRFPFRLLPALDITNPLVVDELRWGIHMGGAAAMGPGLGILQNHLTFGKRHVLLDNLNKIYQSKREETLYNEILILVGEELLKKIKNSEAGYDKDKINEFVVFLDKTKQEHAIKKNLRNNADIELIGLVAAEIAKGVIDAYSTLFVPEIFGAIPEGTQQGIGSKLGRRAVGQSGAAVYALIDSLVAVATSMSDKNNNAKYWFEGIDLSDDNKIKATLGAAVKNRSSILYQEVLSTAKFSLQYHKNKQLEQAQKMNSILYAVENFKTTKQYKLLYDIQAYNGRMTFLVNKILPLLANRMQEKVLSVLSIKEQYSTNNEDISKLQEAKKDYEEILGITDEMNSSSGVNVKIYKFLKKHKDILELDPDTDTKDRIVKTLTPYRHTTEKDYLEGYAKDLEELRKKRDKVVVAFEKELENNKSKAKSEEAQKIDERLWKDYEKYQKKIEKHREKQLKLEIEIPLLEKKEFNNITKDGLIGKCLTHRNTKLFCKALKNKYRNSRAQILTTSLAAVPLDLAVLTFPWVFPAAANVEGVVGELRGEMACAGLVVPALHSNFTSDFKANHIGVQGHSYNIGIKNHSPNSVSDAFLFSARKARAGVSYLGHGLDDAQKGLRLIPGNLFSWGKNIVTKPNQNFSKVKKINNKIQESTFFDRKSEAEKNMIFHPGYAWSKADMEKSLDLLKQNYKEEINKKEVVLSSEVGTFYKSEKESILNFLKAPKNRYDLEGKISFSEDEKKAINENKKLFKVIQLGKDQENAKDEAPYFLSICVFKNDQGNISYQIRDPYTVSDKKEYQLAEIKKFRKIFVKILESTFPAEKLFEDTSWINDSKRIMRLDTKRYDSGVLVYYDLLKNISEQTKKQAEHTNKNIFDLRQHPLSMQELNQEIQKGQNGSYYNPETKKVEIGVKI